MQGKELVSIVRNKLDDDTYDSATILQAGTWFLNELASAHRLRFLEESDTLSASQGDTTVDYPSDHLTTIDIYLTSPQVYGMMQYFIEYGDFRNQHANFATATQSQAYGWTDYGSGMRFAAPLNAAHVFAIDYIRTPRPVEKESQRFELKRVYDEMLVKGTLIRIMDQDEDYDVSDRERQILATLKAPFVRNEGRGGGKVGPIVMRTNRGRRGRE